MQHDDLLFYDIEVFKHNALIVFKNIHKEIIRVFHNDFSGLADFIRGKTLVGFNNHHYDDKIIVYMLEQKSNHLIKKLSDRIISGESVNFISKPKINSLDVSQQIATQRISLKRIEGNMGKMILESSVPFDHPEPLTDEQFYEVLDYCCYDVDTTIDIYLERIESYFQPKQELVEMLGKPEAMKWNTTTISAQLLLDKPLQQWASVRIPPDMWLMVPEPVRELWAKYASSYEPPKGTVNIEEFGCDIQFGFGGLHGAHKHIKRERNVKLLDVKSMYPKIIILLNVLKDATEKYNQMLDKRLAIKHINAILSDALKLILNSVYGNLGNQHSMLYNPKALMSVCFYGQVALYQLCKRLAPFATIININTDGVAFIPEHDGWIAAYKQWEQEFSLELEEKIFDLIVQKDVNSYIAVKGDYMVCKGGDVNRYEKDEFFKNNNSRILDIALVDYLIHGRDIIETLEANLDKPHLFQYILQTGAKSFKGTTDDDGNQYNKVNRVFAALEGDLCLYKQRWDESIVRYADAPLKMFLHNGECSEIENFEEKIDLNHYYNIVKKRLERWI